MPNIMLCKSCGHLGKPRRKSKGSFLIETLLWSVFIIPGIIYSIWKILAKKDVCRKCNSIDLVDPDNRIEKFLASHEKKEERALSGASVENFRKIYEDSKLRSESW